MAKSFEEGANISEAARRNGAARGLLDLKVVLAAQPVDFRKSVHTLSALVSEALRVNPYCGDVFVFRSKRMDRVKLLAWDGSGMVLVTKWLHQGRFTLPRQRLRSIPQTTTADQKPKIWQTRILPKAQSTLQFRAFLVLQGRLIQLRHLP